MDRSNNQRVGPVRLQDRRHARRMRNIYEVNPRRRVPLRSPSEVEKNFKIPVSQIMEKYEKKILNMDMNRPCEEILPKLAEAACVVEGAVDVFGKKVDDLLDRVIKFRDDLRELNTNKLTPADIERWVMRPRSPTDQNLYEFDEE